MLSDDLRAAATATRLIKEAPAADLRRSLDAIADVFDRAAAEAAASEAGCRPDAHKGPLTIALRRALAVLERLGIRSASDALRGVA